MSLDAAGAPSGTVVDTFGEDTSLLCFSAVPVAGEALAVGLSNATPSCAVLLHIEATIAGLGVRPDDPPIVWEALTHTGWTACEVDRGRSDDIWGLNKSGNLMLHVPPGTSRARSPACGQAGCDVEWCPRPGQAPYTASPSVSAISVATIGGTVDAVHAEEITNETVGTSDGTAGQRFALARGPVIADGVPIVVDVIRPIKGSQDAGGAPAAGDGEIAISTGSAQEAVLEEWTEVAHFGASAPADPHVMLDAVAGEVCFGPVVRLADGGLQRYGARPVNGAVIRIRRYAIGGGQRGNVDARTIVRLKSAVPGVAAIETVLRHEAVQIPKRSTKPRFVPLSRCTPAIERSRARTSSTSPVNPPPCWRGHGVW